MEPHPETDLHTRIERLEKRLKLFQVISFAAGIILAATLYVALQSQVINNISGKVLRVRGLIVEDQNGRERVLIGAPIPNVAGRKRKDEMAGVLILGENGVDRVGIAADPTPDPQIKGTVRGRIGTGAGLYVNDKDGNERGGFGFGVLDNNDRMVLGMDYPNAASEAITFAVSADEASMQFKDNTTMARAGLIERNNRPATLYGLNLNSVNLGKESTLSLGVLRLVPYSSRQVVIKANDAEFEKALSTQP
jgi:hypothetical protein